MPRHLAALASTCLALACLAAAALAGEARLRADPHGRYRTEALIDGRAVEVEVATGVAQVLVPTATARRLEVAFDRRSGRRETVLGRDILAFPARLGAVRVGGVAVTEVPALVVDDRRVRRVTLGRDFLARLDQVTVRDGTMTLR